MSVLEDTLWPNHVSYSSSPVLLAVITVGAKMWQSRFQYGLQKPGKKSGYVLELLAHT